MNIFENLRMHKEIDSLTADLAEANLENKRLEADNKRLETDNRMLKEKILFIGTQAENIKWHCALAIASYGPIDAPTVRDTK